VPNIKDLARLFSEKSVEKRLAEAGTAKDYALLYSLWLEKSAVEKSIVTVSLMEDEVDSAELDEIPGGIAAAHKELAIAASEMRRVVNYHLDRKILITCKSKSQVDRRQAELWTEYCRDVNKVHTEFSQILATILNGTHRELLQHS